MIGGVTLHMLECLAEYERGRIAERTRDEIATARGGKLVVTLHADDLDNNGEQA